jgi:hypothetical protein
MTLKDAELTKDIDIRPSSILLWISILAGPVSFIIDFQSRYALVQWACGNHRDWVLVLIAVTSLIAAIGGAFLGWSAFTRLDATLERARFLAISGFILSSIFALTIIANEIPHIFLRSCD